MNIIIRVECQAEQQGGLDGAGPQGHPLHAGRLQVISRADSLRLGNVCIFVQLIFSPPWPANQLYKTPNNT